MNQSNILSRWLKYLEVSHSEHFTEKLFQDHPYKYTLYGISRLLSSYNIENVCVKLEDKNTLHELSVPFLAILAEDFVIVKSVDRDRVVYDWYGEDIIMPLADFMKGWSGVVLIAYPDEKSIEPDYRKHKMEDYLQRSKYAMVMMICFALFLYAFLSRENSNLTDFSVFIVGTITNVCGLYISYLLFLKQLHIQSDIADRICNAMRSGSCNDVLESSASKLFGIYGWSEIGIAYFSVNLCAIALASQIFDCLLLLSMASMGYVIWSVWYQRFRAHSWCPLCLIVLSTFVIQCVGYSAICILAHKEIVVSIFDMALLLAGYAMALLILHLLSPLLVSVQKEQQLRFAFNNLKARKNVFLALQKENRMYSIEDASSLFFGAEDASMTITVFSNPYCNPCAAMHERLDKLRDKSFRIQYVFTYFNEGLCNINKYLIAVYQLYGPEKAWMSLSKWFAGGKGMQEKFFDSMNLNLNAENVVTEFERQVAWSDKNKFNATPTVLVNGQKLAYPYQLEDMLMFIE